MAASRTPALAPRFSRRVIDLFRRQMPPGELDNDDWEAIRVAVRLVCETEQLRASILQKRSLGRNRKVSSWSDSLEGALPFMSWVRELGAMVTGATHPSALPDRLAALMH